MAYQVLARKYRPKRFRELVGQEHVARSLQHALERDRVAHAYLFSGPRGVGKTSVARIFAQALNCTGGQDFEPCGSCSNCQQIAQGSSLAVWEIDGASHNSVDNVRDLIETFRTALPTNIRKRVYIIDEVHMLSLSAFNAFLKSLEEPPSDLVIIMATTESHKIPDTVISRCQRYDFRLLPAQTVGERLKEILAYESIRCDTGTISLVARLCEGSLRDALSLLDRIVSFCSQDITIAEASGVLGVVNKAELFKLSNSILNRDVETSLRILHALGTEGSDTSLILREFVSHWRDLFLASFLDGPSLVAYGISSDEVDDLKRAIAELDRFDIKELNDTAREECDRALRSYHPWYAFEALVVRMATRERAADLERLFSSLVVRKKEQGGQVVSERKKADTIEDPPAQPGAGSLNLDWRGYVDFVKRHPGGRLLAEQLRRVSVEKFEAGVLLLSGDRLAKNYLDRADNQAKLSTLLHEFTKIPSWDVQVRENRNREPEKMRSLEREERQAQSDKKNEIRRRIETSPQMQNLKEVFPGSQIKRIVSGQ